MQAIVMQFIIIAPRVQYVNNFSEIFSNILTFYKNTNIMNLSIRIFKRIFVFCFAKRRKNGRISANTEFLPRPSASRQFIKA